MGRGKFTKAQVEEMKTLYQQGISSVKIAKKFDIDHTMVLYYIGRRTRHATKYQTYKDGVLHNPQAVGKHALQSHTIELRIRESKRRMLVAPKLPTYKDLFYKHNLKYAVRDWTGNIIEWRERSRSLVDKMWRLAQNPDRHINSKEDDV